MIELQHGRDWKREDLAGRVAQRKMDGHRAVWTGTELLTRSGAPFRAPEWFTAGLPAFALDCEITVGGEGSDNVNALRRQDASAWQEARLHVFDCSAAPGGIAARVAFAQQAIGDQQFAEVLPVWEVGSTEAIFAHLRQSLAMGWEGFMVRPAGAPYTPGRNRGILKLKRQSLGAYLCAR